MGSAGTKRKDYYVKLSHVWKGNHWEPAIVVTEQRHVCCWRGLVTDGTTPYAARALWLSSVRAHSKEEAVALALASTTGWAQADAHVLWEREGGFVRYPLDE